MYFSLTEKLLSQIKYYTPDAIANLKGSAEYPLLKGKISFWQVKQGCLVLVEVEGLPQTDIICDSPIFAFHIHEGDRCSGNTGEPFADTAGHYNQGWAWMSIVTNQFSLKEIIEKTAVIHRHFDDLKTQPSGNSGEKIACGVIRATWD